MIVISIVTERYMPDFLLMSIEYGGYVSIVKLIVYLGPVSYTHLTLPTN